MSDNYIRIPFGKFWVMFDLNNGDIKKGGYAWIFATKNEALRHRRIQSKNPNSASLSYPKLVKL